jgi:transcriptional regulator with PAS, ATPase and Fis domain
MLSDRKHRNLSLRPPLTPDVKPLPEGFDAFEVRNMQVHAADSFFKIFQDLACGSVVVDRNARITWIDEKYIAFLGLPPDINLIGRPINEVVENTRMPEVMRESKAIPFDVMETKKGWCVVSRFPLFDGNGVVVGGFGFVMFGDLEPLKSISGKIEALRSDLHSARSKLEALRRSKYNFAQFVGSCDAVSAVKRQARKAAASDSTILILGETGTGKELMAQAIHAASRRANRHFVGINIAAIPEELMEAELFGVKYGAYTGADRSGRVGKVALAHEGTLFLDEVADMPLKIQVKLLRALQEREVEPLGSNTVTCVDVRVIAASSRNLMALIEEGKFRADLYYRLNVVPLTIPPLRERLDDIPLLVEVLIEDICKSQRTAVKEIAKDAIQLLRSHAWPGNVRELRNVLERTCVLSSNHLLTAADFAEISGEYSFTSPSKPATTVAHTLGNAVEQLERKLIVDAWHKSHGNKLQAAKILGISRSNLYAKLQEYGISATDDRP